MKIAFLAQASDAPILQRQILLAPFVLKRYAMNTVGPDSGLEIDVLEFPYSATAHDMFERVVACKPNVLAISVYLWNFSDVMECAALAKQHIDNLIVLVGGPMVAHTAEEILSDHPAIDFVCFQEQAGELVFSEFCRRLVADESLLETPGLVMRDGEHFRRNPPATGTFETGANYSPLIAGDIRLTDPDGYYVTLETSRGCPYDCGYCAWGGTSNKVEFFPLERIFQEIEIVYNSDTVKHVLFVDSNMNLKRSRLVTIIDHIRSQPNFERIHTRMHLQISLIDSHTAQALATLPNFSFDFGLQTTNELALDYIGRRYQSPGTLAEKIHALRSWVPDPRISIDLMLGLPGDNLSGFEKTLDFCLLLEIHRIFLAYPVCLLPGTRFYNERDTMGFVYSQEQPFAVLYTRDFPLEDITRALTIGVWTQIMLYYYEPLREAIFSFFRDNNIVQPGARIEFMKNLIDEVDGRLGIFSKLKINEFRGNVTREFYLQKAEILRRSARASTAIVLFEVVKRHTAESDHLDLGLRVFADYLACDRDPIGLAELAWAHERALDVPLPALQAVHSRFVCD